MIDITDYQHSLHEYSICLELFHLHSSLWPKTSLNGMYKILLQKLIFMVWVFKLFNQQVCKKVAHELRILFLYLYTCLFNLTDPRY